ncbi:fimbrial biogenesis chaperone [Hydrogenophaga sp. R2]|uniref:fimbrial biogenesis chaperone n=1 Tax=Hydrogenophaga sp. R2 TaxID=3132827 RepID=UPI003CE89A3E
MTHALRSLVPLCPGRLARHAFLALLLVGQTTIGWAGSFSVSPVRIYMKPRDRAVAITLTNEGDTAVALQADVFAWSQTADGTDQLVLSEDLILSPPIIRLEAGARQVVRLALLRPADMSQQLTYRLIVREVPEITQPKQQGIQLPIALALSMPVFITPPPARREVACELVRGEAGAPGVSCANTGTAYAQIREVRLHRNDQTLARSEGGAYLLPGARRTVMPKPEGAGVTGIAPLTVEVQFDDGQTSRFTAQLP